MHSKTPNVFKLGALFGLLAVTQAFPALPPKSPGGADPAPAPPGGLCARGSSFGREYDVVDSRGHLHRRCFNDPPPRPQDVELQPPRERQRKKKTKGKSPVPKTKTKTPEQRGAEYIQGFRTQFAPDAPFTQKDWTKYSEQINKNFVEGFDSKTGVFQAATKAGTPGSNKLPVFRGEVRPGSVEVPAMYRSGPESISMYGEVPMKDRPFISDYINRAYTLGGGNRPMTSFSVTSKKTDAHVRQIDQWTGGQSPYTIREDDPRWASVLGSPIGSPLSRAVLEDTTRFQKHRPASVTFTRSRDAFGEGMWSSNYNLVLGPPPAGVGA